MKITKRQLRRMIAEAMPHGGAPDVVGATTGVPGGDIQNLVDEYREWATEYMGTPSGPNSSSVLATFLVDRGLDQGPMADDITKDMAKAMRFDTTDVSRAVKISREEKAAGGTLPDQEIYQRGFKESAMKITKRQLRQIIREEADMMRRRIQTGDTVGIQEAGDIAEFLQQTHGLTFSRAGVDQLVELLSALEASNDLRR